MSIVLDTNYLNIFNVTNSETKENLNLTVNSDERIVSLGTPLKINLENSLKLNDTFSVTINYETTADSAAVQWLSPQMTLGKKSGPPPKRGPNPQGLNIKNNTVKTVKLEKIKNGRQSRQVPDARSKRLGNYTG